MANRKLILTLAKVMVAAAWADGDVTDEEVNSLKDLLFMIPTLTAQQWAELDIYIESPVDAAERARLVEDLQNAIRSPSDKALVIEALDDVINADGVITEDERRVYGEIRSAIDSVDASIFGTLSRLLTGTIKPGSTAAPNREHYIDDFIKNKVFYGVQRRMHSSAADFDITDEQLWKLTLAGALMAQVAHVDHNIDDAEFDAIADALQSRWHLKREEALLVAEVATDKNTANMDFSRAGREFFAVCSHAELASFLEVLFAIAAADGKATHDEIEEIRTISRYLRLSHDQFIQAKLTIPRSQREE